MATNCAIAKEAITSYTVIKLYCHRIAVSILRDGHESMNSTLEQHLIALEKRLLKPEIRASAKELADLLTDDFLEFGRSGRIYNKQAIIDALPLETGEQIIAEGFQIKSLGTDVALITYRSMRQNKDEPRHTLRSSLWRFGEGRWQITFHQGTAVEFTILD